MYEEEWWVFIRNVHDLRLLTVAELIWCPWWWHGHLLKVSPEVAIDFRNTSCSTYLSKLFSFLEHAYLSKLFEEVLHFLEHLFTGMGQNIEFHVARIYEGDGDLIAGVNWHLEWKNRHGSFTRGGGLYKLTREGERLMINPIHNSELKPT
ncbi:hypothetical protein L1887_20639 [Cichorium endivia]|nr:hypothetical protein L1887_20639 [Cichorium endivia]